jgi:hypothetical protein
MTNPCAEEILLFYLDQWIEEACGNEQCSVRFLKKDLEKRIDQFRNWTISRDMEDLK